MNRKGGDAMFWTRLVVAGVVLLGAGATAKGADAKPVAKADQDAKVKLLRVPHQGIQPQVAVDAKGTVHLIYYSGPAGSGDVFYVHSEDGGVTFSRPVRVNSEPRSAIAIGNIRGAHLAVGKGGRLHVAWNGSDKTKVKGPRYGWPMLYTRLNDAGTEFEPQRNVIQEAFGLDGGGSVTADDRGNVYVTWHAPAAGAEGEVNRRVWVVRSTDDGKTFAREQPAYAEPTGACGCCGLRAFADRKGNVYVLYRAATEKIHRDMYLLTSTDRGTSFQGADVGKWDINACPMSTAAFAQSVAGVLAAWETKGQVYYARINPETGQRSPAVAAPGDANDRKFPVVAGNARGETILVWTEGMGWNQGGSLAWQVYDKAGKPTAEKGKADGVPTWSLVAVFARPDGGFTILY
jgi:hypothetical protein